MESQARDDQNNLYLTFHNNNTRIWTSFVCPICEFDLCQKLTPQHLTHSNTNPYLCLKCAKCFETSSGYRRHTQNCSIVLTPLSPSVWIPFELPGWVKIVQNEQTILVNKILEHGMAEKAVWFENSGLYTIRVLGQTVVSAQEPIYNYLQLEPVLITLASQTVCQGLVNVEYRKLMTAMGLENLQNRKKQIISTVHCVGSSWCLRHTACPLLSTSQVCSECCKLKQKLTTLQEEWIKFTNHIKDKPLDKMSKQELIDCNINLQFAIKKLQEDHNKSLQAIEDNNVELSSTQAQLMQKILEETSNVQSGILPLLIKAHLQYHQRDPKNGRRYHPS